MHTLRHYCLGLVLTGIAAVHAPLFAQDDRGSGTIKIGAGVSRAKSSKNNPPAAVPATVQQPAPIRTPTFTVTGGFETTPTKAFESALVSAVDRLHEHLRKEEPPIDRRPTTELVRRMLVKFCEGTPETSAVKGLLPADVRNVVKVMEQPIPSGEGTEKMYRVEIGVEVSGEHVRAMRSRERSPETLWAIAGVAGLFMLFAIYFRVDAWTKGYLTRWLVPAFVGAAGVVVGLWFYARHW